MQKRVRLAAAFVALVAATAACSARDDDSGGGSGDGPIVVGSTLSLTGVFAATGSTRPAASSAGR